MGMQDTIEKLRTKAEKYAKPNKEYGESHDKEYDKEYSSKNAGIEMFLLMSEADLQTHIWHLQTTSQAEHATLNMFYDGVRCFKDTLLELYIGSTDDRIPGGKKEVEISFTYSPGQAREYIKAFKKKMMKFYKHKDIHCPGITAQLDEVNELANKVLYLLTLK